MKKSDKARLGHKGTYRYVRTWNVLIVPELQNLYIESAHVIGLGHYKYTGLTVFCKKMPDHQLLTFCQ